MPIQLKEDPKIKINGEELEGYTIQSFKMTKRLLEPNRMEFTIRKKDMTLTQDDIKFEMRKKLLGALVECSVKANRRLVEGGWVTDEVNDFFRGYIQHVNLIRANNKDPMTIKCIAYSPDARMKMFPNCKCFFDDRTLDLLVGWIIQSYSEDSKEFDKAKGDYYTYEDDKKNIDLVVDPSYKEVMPYIVQYHESDYDFLARMAKRFGEFFYYEDGKIVFGKMVEREPINVRTGYDIEEYDYDLNMSSHTGIVLTDFDEEVSNVVGIGAEKHSLSSYDSTVEPIHEMSETVYEKSSAFFNDERNEVADLRSAHKNPIAKHYNFWNLAGSDDFSGEWKGLTAYDRRRILDKYVMADTLVCRGKSRRADLKLGSVIVIEDETNLGWLEKTDIVQHEPLKVIDLTYEWSPKTSRMLTNEFKAIPQKSDTPPYLERDEHGFLTYGDFDLYPKSGPQHGVVVDTKDPDQNGRVLVVLDWQLLFSDTFFSGGHSYVEAKESYFTTPWIRVAQPYAGGETCGAYLIPEVGDEVMVGFEHNNVERPYVMCSLYNFFANPAAKDWKYWENACEVPNEYKAIRTRNGHTIEIRDKGKHGYIKIYDNETQNYVVTYDTDKKLIRLQSKGNIELVADRNIVLNAGNNIVMDAKNDIESHAKNDIRRTADHDVKDTVGNDYGNSVGHDFNTWITESNTHVHMIKEKIQLELDDKEKILAMEPDGVSLLADNEITIQSKDRLRVTGKFQAVFDSDLEVDVDGKQVNVDGEVEVNVKGGLVKIN